MVDIRLAVRVATVLAVLSPAIIPAILLSEASFTGWAGRSCAVNVMRTTQVMKGAAGQTREYLLQWDTTGLFPSTLEPKGY